MVTTRLLGASLGTSTRSNDENEPVPTSPRGEEKLGAGAPCSIEVGADLGLIMDLLILSETGYRRKIKGEEELLYHQMGDKKEPG